MYDLAMKCVRTQKLLLTLLLWRSITASAEEFELKLQPGKIFEPCMALTVDQVLHFKFKSDQNLRFNIHSHVGDDVENNE